MKYIKESKEDTIILLYHFKFGIRQLSVIKSETDLAQNVLGLSPHAFKVQSENIDRILSKREQPSKLQKEVLEEYNVMTENELRNEVLNIINNADRKSIITERMKILLEKEKKDKIKEEKKRLDNIFRKMGKDPAKMKFVGSRPKEISS
jgi:hypothetical protein